MADPSFDSDFPYRDEPDNRLANSEITECETSGLKLKEIADRCTAVRLRDGVAQVKDMSGSEMILPHEIRVRDEKIVGLKQPHKIFGAVKSPHLSHIKAGVHRATQRLLHDLRIVSNERRAEMFAQAFGKSQIPVELLGCSKGPGVRLNDAIKAHVSITIVEYLVRAVVGLGDKPALPKGIFGVSVRLGDMFLIYVDEGQAGTSCARVLAHELELVARRLRGIQSKPGPPRSLSIVSPRKVPGLLLQVGNLFVVFVDYAQIADLATELESRAKQLRSSPLEDPPRQPPKPAW